MGRPAGTSDALMERHWTPHFDVSETDKALLVDAELPGIRKEDISIQLDGNVLTVEGETRRQRREDKEHWHYVERRYGKFHRRVELPESCDLEAIRAKHDNGVLHIEIPKREESQPGHRTIDIE